MDHGSIGFTKSGYRILISYVHSALLRSNTVAGYRCVGITDIDTSNNLWSQAWLCGVGHR